MSGPVKRQFDTLKVLSKAPKKLRVAVINNATLDLILALTEVIHDVLVGTVKLTPTEIKRLHKYHRTLIQITERSTPLKKKKALITQHGGFLLTLLPPALAVLSAIISQL